MNRKPQRKNQTLYYKNKTLFNHSWNRIARKKQLNNRLEGKENQIEKQDLKTKTKKEEYNSRKRNNFGTRNIQT